MEANLYSKYKQLRKQGLEVKFYWFMIGAKQLLANMESDAQQFMVSDGWLDVMWCVMWTKTLPIRRTFYIHGTFITARGCFSELEALLRVEISSDLCLCFLF